MTIYLIKQRLHYSIGEPSEWINLYAETSRAKANQAIAKHRKFDEENNIHQKVDYSIEEIKVFDL